MLDCNGAILEAKDGAKFTRIVFAFLSLSSQFRRNGSLNATVPRRPSWQSDATFIFSPTGHGLFLGAKIRIGRCFVLLGPPFGIALTVPYRVRWPRISQRANVVLRLCPVLACNVHNCFSHTIVLSGRGTCEMFRLSQASPLGCSCERVFCYLFLILCRPCRRFVVCNLELIEISQHNNSTAAVCVCVCVCETM